MSKTKKDRPALGADYSAKMKSRYAEKLIPLIRYTIKQIVVKTV